MDNYNQLSHSDVLSLLPDRDPNSHKGDFGHVLMLCGSRGYTGAAALAAMGALRTGAGLVFLGVPESIYEIEAIKLTEPVVFPLPDESGMLSEAAIPAIMDRLPKMDEVVIGCGCGKSRGVAAVLRYVLENAKCPVIVDADGINLLSKHTDILRGRTFPTILTPHEVEFTRIGGQLSDGRIDGAVNLAKDLSCVVLLKGHHTCITDGDTIYVNQTGNAGMAVGGSGDVLAGMIAGLLGQGMDSLQAAACAAWLHGAAGDICAEQMGQYAMLPTDMLNVLPRLLK